MKKQAGWVTRNGCRVHQVLKGTANSYLVSNGHGLSLLVDTGRKSQLPALVEGMDDLGVSAATLAGLILTHAHYDHTGNAAAMKEKYGVRIIAHTTEADALISGKNAPIGGTIFPARVLIGILARSLSRRGAYAPVAADYVVEDHRDLAFLGFSVSILSTPGHTPGSMSVVVDDEVALVGDAMFGIFRGSILPPFGTDLSKMVESWGRLIDTGCGVFLPGHGTFRDRKLVMREYEKHRKKQHKFREE